MDMTQSQITRVPTVQVIDGDGSFQASGVAAFLAEHKFSACKTKYQVVAIMGPQSSGKSTLLNHVFGTDFTMMDAMTGRSQTTKGIWMCKSPKLAGDINTLVMDLEGCDGRERGEDDTNFERQSALFALAVADVLLVNVWCHDIGREHGSGKPLLRTIFQVNLKLFAPEPNRAKSMLLFVIRDKTRTPLPKLVEVMESDLDKMWESIAKPPQYTDSKLRDFFNVQYAGLSHFEEKYEDFLADTVMLRRRFTTEGDESLVDLETDRLPADSFAMSTEQIWDVIHSQKDLNLPAHKIMVANIRCAEIREQQLGSFLSDQAWGSLRAECMAGIVLGFSSRAVSLADSCIAGYDTEAAYFDSNTRAAMRGELLSRLYTALKPVYLQQVAFQRGVVLKEFEQELRMAASEASEPFAPLAARLLGVKLASFRVAFEENVCMAGTPWDHTEQISDTTAALVATVRRVTSEKVASAMARTEKQLAAHVSGPVIGLLDSCPENLWSHLHAVVRESTAAAERTLFQALDGYGLSPGERAGLSSALAVSSRARMEGHVREAALTRLSRMKDRFTEVFTLDGQKTPRTWGARDDIAAIATQARSAAATMLAQLAVIRAAGLEVPSEGDHVERSIMQLADNASGRSSDATAAGNSGSGSGSTTGASSRYAVSELHAADVPDIHSMATWPGVAEEQVLLQPHEARTSWREFVSTSNVTVQQALATQQANRLASNRPPPFWAIAAILLLGWNEAMAVLFSPLYLVLGGLVFLFLRTLYTELDVDREMARGALPGVLSLGNKLVPAVRKVLTQSWGSIQALATAVPQEFTKLQAAGPPSPQASGGTSSHLNRSTHAESSYSQSSTSDSHPAATHTAARRAAGASSAEQQEKQGFANANAELTESRKDQ
ncbi:MAG: hypothetical protein WDW36_006707 [Sanguina aurantia]